MSAKTSAEVAKEFWDRCDNIDVFPFRQERLAADFVYLDRLIGGQSILDVGCGDGSHLLHFKDKQLFGCDLNNAILPRTKERLAGIATITDIKEPWPLTDVAICLGVFIYFLDDRGLEAFISRFEADHLIVRCPCAPVRTEVNTFSQALNSNYAAVYRTVEEITALLEPTFSVDTFRAWPDEIESKFDTRHWVFDCRRRG